MTAETATRILTIVSAVGAGVIGGLFFAFSTFVMTGLNDLPPSQGIAAMQSINRAAPKDGLFVTLFIGIAVTCGLLIVMSLLKLDEPGAWLRIAGGAAYMPAIVLTAAYHVPRNDELAKLDPQSASSVRFWSSYVGDWTTWNHVRALGPIIAVVLLVVSLRRG